MRRRTPLALAAHPDDVAELERLAADVLTNSKTPIEPLSVSLIGGNDVDVLFESIKGGARVLLAISPSLLRARDVLHSLLKTIALEDELQAFAAATVPVELSRRFGLGREPQWSREKLTDYWVRQKQALEKDLHPQGTARLTAAQRSIARDLEHIRLIVGNIGEFFDLIDGHPHLCNPDQILESSELRMQIIEPLAPTVQSASTRSSSAPLPQESRLKELRAIAGLIVVPSDNQPEYPWLAPRFPATNAYNLELDVPRHGRSKVTIKDEGENWTGSHKDRMAWEIVVHYKRLIRQILAGGGSQTELPAASVISNGAAAFAVQSALRYFRLPDLHVLLDNSTKPSAEAWLKALGCKVSKTDLSEMELSSEEILKQTENQGGFDITSRDYIDPGRVRYYDWLSYEILNLLPKFIFVPVGTGDLLHNIARVLRAELEGLHPDPRLSREARENIWGISLLGATTFDENSNMDKLYARFRPPLNEMREYILEQRDTDFFGELTELYEVSDANATLAERWATSKGLRTEPSGIAGLALFLQLSKQGQAFDGKVLVVNTGKMRIPEGLELEEEHDPS